MRVSTGRAIFVNGALFVQVLGVKPSEMTDSGEDTLKSGGALNVGSREDDAACDDAFALLVRRRSQFVFRVAFSVLRDVQDAEDVAQETFLKLFRLGGWKDLADERAFLARVAWRLAVSRIRRRGGERTDAEAVDSTPNAEAGLIRASLEATIHRLMDALPVDLRLPLALWTVDEMTSPQIAKVTGIPEGTVRTRLKRAREILKRKLQDLEVRRG